MESMCSSNVVALMRLLPNMATRRQFSVLSENEIVQFQGHVCLITKICNRF